MSGGSGRVRTGGGPSRQARVENERLWVDAQISGGGGGIAANVTIVGPLPVPVSIVSSIPLVVSGTVSITGQPIAVTGTVAISGTVTITGTVAVSSIIPGTGATNLGKAEDAVHATGDVGVMALAVRQDTATALAANNDYIPLIVDASGRLHANVGVVTPGTAATNLGKAEDAVHASGDVGIMPLAVRQDTAAALAANGDYIPLTTDAIGRLRVLAVEPYTILPLSSSTNGQPIAIDTAVFTTIHTVAALVVDVISIFVTNVGITDRTIFIGWGGTATGQQVWAFVPAKETVCAISEMPLNASQVVQARLDIAGTCRVVGRVTRRPV